MYNEHWDNFIAQVRDHHLRGIFQYSYYEGIRKLARREFSRTYRPDPIMCPKVTKKVELAREVKLPETGMESLVASLVATHEQTEQWLPPTGIRSVLPRPNTPSDPGGSGED